MYFFAAMTTKSAQHDASNEGVKRARRCHAMPKRKRKDAAADGGDDDDDDKEDAAAAASSEAQKRQRIVQNKLAR